MTKTKIALSAASLFLSASCKKSEPVAPVTATTTEAVTASVKCQGVNECKGTSKCGVPGGHGCAGQNECKGKGWVEATEADCTAKAGTVLK